MAGKLVTLDEAAAKLGISTDQLSELRQRGDIFGYRDGTSWKFKPEDVDRLAEDRADADSGDSSEAVLLSEFELGASGPSTSSTVIGQMGQMQSPEDSDIQLTRHQAPGSDLKMTGSDVKLFDHKDDALVLNAGSDVGLGGDPGDLTQPPESARGMGSSKKDIGFNLADNRPDQVNLQGGSSPDADLTANPADNSSALDLGGSSEDELVLHGSGKGSDITISPGDSGISLVDPADSGISLEGPLDLNSPADSEEFELSSSEDMIGLNDSADFDSDAVMELQSDDDFLLTPLEEAGDEDSQDSGSQVIALDTEGDFADSAATMMTQSSGNLGAMLEADEFGEPSPLGGGPGLGGPALAAGPVIMSGSPARDAQFSAITVFFLGSCAVLLGLCGMMMFELMRTMWGREEPMGLNSSIMDMVSGLFG